MPRDCYKIICKIKKSKGMWGFLVLDVFWMVWLERNERVFEDFVGVEVEELWDKVRFWSAFWASFSRQFSGVCTFFKHKIIIFLFEICTAHRHPAYKILRLFIIFLNFFFFSLFFS